MKEVVQIMAAFMGSFAYAILFNIRGKKMLWASVGGMITWSIYILVGLGTLNEYYKYFLASLFLGAYSQVVARTTKTPATVYLTIGSIPLVPGRALFMTMESLFAKNLHAAFTYGSTVVNIAIAITGGMVLEIVFTNLYDFYKKSKNKVSLSKRL